jgi:hypothetical protein
MDTDAAIAPVAPARKTALPDWDPAATPSTRPNIETTPSDIPKTISPAESWIDSLRRDIGEGAATCSVIYKSTSSDILPYKRFHRTAFKAMVVNERNRFLKLRFLLIITQP